MDTFLEPHEVDQLTRELRELGDDHGRLEAAIARHASRAPGSLARSDARPSSTPPIDVHAYDLVDLVRAQITGWVRCLLDDSVVEPPADTSTRSLCHHLATNADRIALQPWARDCADEIAETCEQVRQVIEPRDPGSITSRHHASDAEVRHRAHLAVGTAEDMAAVHRKVTGQELKVNTLLTWRRRERLPKHVGPAGEAWFHYFEVAQLAKEAEVRRAKRGT